MKPIPNEETDPQHQNNLSSSPDGDANTVLREWRESAFYWRKHSDVIRTIFQPLTDALIEEAHILEGQSVLDVAGGSGEPSLTIAKTIGPTGSVICTDAAAEMVDAARYQAQRRGIKNVAFQQCSAELLPFENQVFDAVVCRLGAMFFPDPVAALREMLRVTKSGGVVSLVVWNRSEVNPFFHVVSKIIEPYFDSAPADANAPGAFRFAERGELADLLRQAGASGVKERVLKFQIAAPISVKEFWEFRSETSGTLREKLAALPREKVDLIAEEVEQEVRDYFPNNEMDFPGQTIIVTGRA